MDKYAGIFITMEGPDGSGKTSQMALLAEALSARGLSVLRAREPGGTIIGERIRALVHDPAYTEMHPTTEALLYAAARAQIVAQLIRPALEAGQVLLCDRFIDSTFAYQGYGRGIDLVALRQVTALATGGLLPDLTLYLDLPAETGLARRHEAAEEWNRLDAASLAFHKRVVEGYRRLIEAEPSRWQVVDATGPVDLVHAAILPLVLERLKKHGLLSAT